VATGIASIASRSFTLIAVGLLGAISDKKSGIISDPALKADGRERQI